jgi:hypothetical protein
MSNIRASQILNSITMRSLGRSLTALAADDATAVEKCAETLWTAYAQLINEGPWPSLALPPATITPTDLKISKASLGDPLFIRFFDGPPFGEDPVNSVSPRDDDSVYYYFWANDQLYARSWPQAPTFVATGVAAGPVGVPGAIIYVHQTRAFYREIAGDPDTAIESYADPLLWEPHPTLWAPAQKYVLHTALADLLGNGEQERLQAKGLYQIAEDEAQRLWNTYLLNEGTPQ